MARLLIARCPRVHTIVSCPPKSTSNTVQCETNALALGVHHRGSSQARCSTVLSLSPSLTTIADRSPTSCSLRLPSLSSSTLLSLLASPLMIWGMFADWRVGGERLCAWSVAGEGGGEG